jgi:uncharacterized membrane protein
MEMDIRLLGLGILFLTIGTILILVGMLKGAGRAEGGGVILIGPFPIAFGTSEAIAKVMLAIGIALVVFMVLLHLLLTS